MEDGFAKPILDLTQVEFSRTPEIGKGLQLDERGMIPESAREIRTGLASERPTAAVGNAGLFYFATDTLVLSYSNGSAWSDEAGIDKTIVDAKGDLIVATAADTVSRLAVGTDGHVLTADSAQATGVKWASSGLQSVIARRTTATALNSGALGALAGETELQDDWGGYTVGNEFIILPTVGIYSVGATLLTSGGTGSFSVASRIEIQRYNSSIAFQEYVAATSEGFINGGMTATGLVETTATNDRVYFYGQTGASGTGESWIGRFWATRLS